MRILKIFIAVWAFGLITGLTSCKINCPDFNKDFLNWIPYQENDVIELYSQSKDSTIIFLIENVEVTHQTHYHSNTKCGGCDDDISINYGRSDFFVRIYLHEKKIVQQEYWIGDTPFFNHSESVNFIFEDKEYERVMIFETPDTSAGTFKKLIIAKGFGIIGLIDIDGNTWVVQPKVKKDGAQKIVIHNTSC